MDRIETPLKRDPWCGWNMIVTKGLETMIIQRAVIDAGKRAVQLM